MTSVRDATLDRMRGCGLTTIFANPGSTEIPFLADLPEDLRFVLALHEASVVGVAAGYALATDRPAFVNVHTTAGLGNAVGALATARVNRVPLVVVVGQQDRRHLELEPFLTGRLAGLAGDYPVAVHQPARPQDLPALIARAHHEATTARGPTLVVAPMGDWSAPMDSDPPAVPTRVVRPVTVDPDSLGDVLDLARAATRPAVVAGAGADSPGTWEALALLAERLSAPVWQEAFGARAGFPQDHHLFAGHLSSSREQLRAALAGHDLVLVVGAIAFRQYQYEPGPFVDPDARVVVLTDDPAQAQRSAADLAVLAPVEPTVRALADRLDAHRSAPTPASNRRAGEQSSAAGPLTSTNVFHALAARIRPDTFLVEEAPSDRPELERTVPVRRPLGFLSAAMGGLGFGLPAAIGLRLACPETPVVAVLGDGSSLYSVQALWTAVHYRCGVLVVVLANGGYAVMDQLAASNGAKGPWPGFPEVSVGTVARGFGCPVRTVASRADLEAELDDIMPGLPDRDEPVVLEATVTLGSSPSSSR
ncbi:MAG: thiamine pyrophosphate-dependent enzyme [Streptosporangiales bacterium]